MTDVFAPIAACAAYSLATALAFGALLRSVRTQTLASLRERGSALETILIVIGVCLHALWLANELAGNAAPRFGFAPALSSMLLVACAAYVVESRVAPIGAIRLLLLPLAAIAVLLPLGFPGTELPLANLGSSFAIHFMLALLAYGLLAIAALHALAMVIIDTVLHSPGAGAAAPAAPTLSRSGLLELLPPLLSMESLLFRTLSIGFVALTLTLITGIGFHEQVFARPLAFDHKTVFSVVSWITFATLLFGRWRYGWRGRAALRYVFSGFVLLLLAYVGTHFVLEVILGRR